MPHIWKRDQSGSKPAYQKRVCRYGGDDRGSSWKYLPGRWGIILGYNTVIDRQKLGYHITAFINLELSADQKSEFYPFINSCPNVLECNCITGVYSMLIKVAFPSTQELDTFIGKIQRFGNTSTQIVFSTPVPQREIIVEPNS